MAKNETVKITLKKSIIGSPEKHTRIVKALGLTKPIRLLNIIKPISSWVW